MLALSLQSDVSPLLVAVCLLVGGLLAALVYWRQGPFSSGQRWLMATLRAAWVSLVALLLLDLSLTATTNQEQPPRVALLVDNSQSVGAKLTPGQQSRLQTLLDSLTQSLQAEGAAVSQVFLHGDSLAFDGPGSDLSDFLRDQEKALENRGLSSMVLFSDGIATAGLDPAYHRAAVPVHVVALGDTTRQEDLAVAQVSHNKVTYLGNSFPVEVVVRQRGYAGQALTVRLQGSTGTLARQQVRSAEPEALHTVRFQLPAEQVGLQRFRAVVDSLGSEKNTVNNAREFVVEVVETRKKVLLMAAAPHPDLKAIAAALQLMGDYTVTRYIPGVDPVPPGETDLLVLHSLPDRPGSALYREVARRLSQAGGAWFISGTLTNLYGWSQVNKQMSVQQRGLRQHPVKPALQAGFDLFGTPEQLAQALRAQAPGRVPYGQVVVQGEHQVLLRQQVGQVETPQALLAVGQAEGQRVASLLGGQLWQWRLLTYAELDTHQPVDQLVQQVVKYLTAKDDLSKFRVFPTAQRFTSQATPSLAVEIYNDLLEPQYGTEVDLRLESDQGQVIDRTFVFGPETVPYSLERLAPGVYSFVARSTVNGKAMTSQGQFSVTEEVVELVDLQARHDALRSLAANSGGTFQRWGEPLHTLEPGTPKLFSFVDSKPLVNIWVLLLVVAALAVVEWFLRRYWSSY